MTEPHENAWTQMRRQAKLARDDDYTLAEAIDDGGWNKQDNKVWTRLVVGKPLVYYPTKQLMVYDNGAVQETTHVDVYRFIYKLETAELVQGFKKAHGQPKDKAQYEEIAAKVNAFRSLARFTAFGRIIQMRQRLEEVRQQ